MRIISRFKDYYDSAQAYGQDASTVYQRETREMLREDLLPHMAWENALAALGVELPSLTLRDETRLWGSRRADVGAVFFCGKVHPFYVLTTTDDPERRERDPARETVRFSWDSAFEGFVEQSPFELKDEGPWRPALAAQTGRAAAAPNLEHHSPVVVMMPGGHLGDCRAPGFRAPRIIVDPCLKDLGFQKAVDPFTAFQEISIFVGGVLAETRDPPSPLSDKEKVVSHGLDPVYGFRKPPKR